MELIDMLEEQEKQYEDVQELEEVVALSSGGPNMSGEPADKTA